MFMRYKILVDVYECIGEDCKQHDTGHFVRKGMKINVTAESDLGARREVLNRCYNEGKLVKKLVVKEISSII